MYLQIGLFGRLHICLQFMIAYSLLSVVDADLWIWVDADDADASVGCSSSNRIIFNDSGTTPSTGLASRH